MNPFQSDNIWKRQARAKKLAANPRTPYEEWRSKMASDGLWLAGGLILLVLYGQAMRAGVMEVTVTTTVVAVVVALYCGVTAVQLGRRWRGRPPRDTGAAGRKRWKK